MKAWRLLTAVALAVVLAAGVAVLVQRQLAAGTFDRLEAASVAQNAQRLATALGDEREVLTRTGAANAVWNATHHDVLAGDETSFSVDLAPATLASLYRVDGVFGVRVDNRVVVGGLGGADADAPLPAALSDPAVVARMWDPHLAAGTASCGLVSTPTTYLYCGFGAYLNSGEGAPSGGLVFLQRYDGGTVAALGQRIGLPLPPGR